MSRVLALNPGSSSLKASLVVDGHATSTAAWDLGEVDGDTWVVEHALRRWRAPDAVVVRFVHGGSREGSVLLDEPTLEALDRLSPLAPLHQPMAVHVARSARQLMPDVPVIASFDTEFHAGMPPAAAHYALPRDWMRQERLRRYGFHGLSCRHAVRRTAELLDRDPGELRMLCCHLGAGVSVTAIHGGRSVDTSMGFTALEGAAMATRSGSVDPGLLLHLLHTGSMTVRELEDALYHRSGLAGLSGTSGDMRAVLAAGTPDAAFALDVYLHRLRREIGAAAMSLDRLDAVAFTGGVADHQPEVVEMVVRGLPVLGVAVSRRRCRSLGDRIVSPDGAAVAVLFIGTREELELARDAEAVLSSAGRARGASPAR